MKVQKNKQVLSGLVKRVSEGLSSCKPPDNSGRINARWTNEELLIAVQGNTLTRESIERILKRYITNNT